MASGLQTVKARMAPAPLILLQEDDPHLAEAIELALDQEGFRCRSVRDGAQALEFCHELLPEEPDLWVGEAMTPVLSGLEFLQMDGSWSFPRLVLGAHPLLLQEALDLGAIDVIQKPFRIEDLLEKISRLLLAKEAPSAEEQVRGLRAGHVSVLECRSPLQLAQKGLSIPEFWLDSLCGLLKLECARIELPLEGEFWCAAAGGPLASQYRHRHASRRTSLSELVLRSQESLWISDLNTVPLFSASSLIPEFKNQGIRSFSAIPLGLGSGVLSLMSTQPQLITHLDAEILKMLGAAVARDTWSQRQNDSAGLTPSEWRHLLELLIPRAAAMGEALSVIRFEGLTPQQSEGPSRESASWWETTLLEQKWGDSLWVSWTRDAQVALCWGQDAIELQASVAELPRPVLASVFDATRFLGAPQWLHSQLFAALFSESLESFRQSAGTRPKAA